MGEGLKRAIAVAKATRKPIVGYTPGSLRAARCIQNRIVYGARDFSVTSPSGADLRQRTVIARIVSRETADRELLAAVEMLLNAYIENDYGQGMGTLREVLQRPENYNKALLERVEATIVSAGKR